MRMTCTLSLLPGLLFLTPIAGAAEPPSKPNIVLIYADDVGFGDVSCYGATGVNTPNIDRLAAQGLRFTQAHATSATCTPSRYSMLTGEYAWRKKGTGVLPGNAALIIEPGRLTLPLLLKRAGYATGVVGKWHLGLGPEGGPDWNGEVKPGPLEIGFDYAFVMPATGDRVPCIYVENHRVVGLDAKDPIAVSYTEPFTNAPTGKANPELLRIKPSHGHDQSVINGISRIGYMTGGSAALWRDEDMADDFTRRGVAFIERSAKQPFFLYFATHDIHVPRVPHPRFAGKTAMGPRGDAIVQLDWCVGEILAALDRLKLAENTLVIFTSDNGPVVDDGYQDDATGKLGAHKPAGPLRGGKYTIFEGGTREPFMVRWPARVMPGVSDALVSQVDLLASFASLTSQTLPDDAASDSFNVLPALLGDSKQGRAYLVEHAGRLSLRQGDWKFIPRAQGATGKRGQGAAGKRGQGAKSAQPQKAESAPALQLYNLAADVAETNNVADQHPDLVKKFGALLEDLKQRGRSRP